MVHSFLSESNFTERLQLTRINFTPNLLQLDFASRFNFVKILIKFIQFDQGPARN